MHGLRYVSCACQQARERGCFEAHRATCGGRGLNERQEAFGDVLERSGAVANGGWAGELGRYADCWDTHARDIFFLMFCFQSSGDVVKWRVWK